MSAFPWGKLRVIVRPHCPLQGKSSHIYATARPAVRVSPEGSLGFPARDDARGSSECVDRFARGAPGIRNRAGRAPRPARADAVPHKYCM